MSDQPSTAANQNNITISLSDMAQRYLGAMQNIYDTAAIVVQGTREVNERGFDDLTAAARFMPSQKQRRPFLTAKPVAERWVLKNLLSDAFGLFIPFIEDARTICALHEWKVTGSNQATLPAIFQEERAAFLKLDTAGKLAHLSERFQLQIPLTEHMAGLESLAGCLVRDGGVVPAGGAPLAFTLVALDLVASPESDQKVQPRMGELKKEFAPGSTVELEKVEHMNALATVSLFMNATLRQLQEKIKDQAAA
jgi:hypothetical protein